MRTWPGVGPVAWLALAFLALGAGVAWADDCTDWGNCAMAPRNIDVATGIAAAGPFILLGWRYLSRRNGTVLAPPARTPAELIEDARLVKEDFERLERELHEEASRLLSDARTFNKAYNDKWAEAMGELEDYLNAYRDLVPDLNTIWEQFGNREWALQVADMLDTAISAAQMGRNLTRLGLRSARKAADTTPVAALSRAARTRPGPPDPEWHRAGRELLKELDGVNPGAGRRNCVRVAEAVERRLRGIPDATAPAVGSMPFDHAKIHLETTFGGSFTKMKSKADLDAALAAAGPDARGIVVIVDPQRTAHAFNAVKRRGHVFYPDGQVAELKAGWNPDYELWFLPTN